MIPGAHATMMDLAASSHARSHLIRPRSTQKGPMAKHLSMDAADEANPWQEGGNRHSIFMVNKGYIHD